jgi:hypothetical protein
MKTAINNTPNNSSIWSKKKVLPIVAIVFSVGILLTIGLGRWVLYWIYYKPFYSDFYQYNKLQKLQQENKNRIILVYYLPNTKRMLKYDFKNEYDWNTNERRK